MASWNFGTFYDSSLLPFVLTPFSHRAYERRMIKLQRILAVARLAAISHDSVDYITQTRFYVMSSLAGYPMNANTRLIAKQQQHHSSSLYYMISSSSLLQIAGFGIAFSNSQILPFFRNWFIMPSMRGSLINIFQAKQINIQEKRETIFQYFLFMAKILQNWPKFMEEAARIPPSAVQCHAAFV